MTAFTENLVLKNCVQIANLYELYSAYSTRTDAAAKRVSRIEGRLEISDENP